ncbi:hypothetical protein OC844_008052, partial [Tilletia horrida]
MQSSREFDREFDRREFSRGSLSTGSLPSASSSSSSTASPQGGGNRRGGGGGYASAAARGHYGSMGTAGGGNGGSGMGRRSASSQTNLSVSSYSVSGSSYTGMRPAHAGMAPPAVVSAPPTAGVGWHGHAVQAGASGAGGTWYHAVPQGPGGGMSNGGGGGGSSSGHGHGLGQAYPAPGGFHVAPQYGYVPAPGPEYGQGYGSSGPPPGYVSYPGGQGHYGNMRGPGPGPGPSSNGSHSGGGRYYNAPMSNGAPGGGYFPHMGGGGGAAAANGRYVNGSGAANATPTTATRATSPALSIASGSRAAPAVPVRKPFRAMLEDAGTTFQAPLTHPRGLINQGNMCFANA